VKLRILDEEYILWSPAPPTHLERLAKLVDQKMRELMAKEPRLSVTRSAVLTAMTFADQAITEEKKWQELQAELERQKGEVARLQAELNCATTLAADLQRGEKGWG
jgi:cell division protein ZapA